MCVCVCVWGGGGGGGKFMLFFFFFLASNFSIFEDLTYNYYRLTMLFKTHIFRLDYEELEESLK